MESPVKWSCECVVEPDTRECPAVFVAGTVMMSDGSQTSRHVVGRVSQAMQRSVGAHIQVLVTCLGTIKLEYDHVHKYNEGKHTSEVVKLKGHGGVKKSDKKKPKRTTDKK